MSCSYASTSSDMPHASTSGPRSRGDGTNQRMMRMRPWVKSSRLSARYAAKNATKSTLAISFGSKLSGPIPTHSRPPPRD